MTTPYSDQEDKIRQYYRDIRDKLKSTSTKCEIASKATIRPDVSTLYGIQSDVFDWLAEIFSKFEKLELDSLHREEDIIATLGAIRAWQRVSANSR